MDGMERGYLDELARSLAATSPEAVGRRIAEVVAAHDAWRAERLNLLASDNVLSRTARRLLDSDLATRIAEGVPGERDYPPPPITRFADELEGIVIVAARELYRVPHVEWRPHSTSVANAVLLAALTEPGDTILVQGDHGAGGNFGYQEGALPALRGLRALEMPAAGAFGVDLERTRALARRARPRLLLVGGGSVLFPYPVTELRAIADEVGAALVYDAAHVGLLIAAGMFQDPLGEGAAAMTTGTHKIGGGPLGGLVLTRDADTARRVTAAVYPGLIQTRDQNKFAAAAMAMTEMRAFGAAYARQCVANARALGSALAAAGFAVVAADRGFTATHQVFLDLRGRDVPDVVRRLIGAGLLVQANPLPGAAAGEPRAGMRVTVQEATRRGMVEADMTELAAWFRRAALEGEDAERVASEVAATMRVHARVAYSFDPTD